MGSEDARIVGGGAGDWTVADEGWGRRATDFATLSEPANCREYVALHHLLGVDNGDRLLDGPQPARGRPGR
jgi:hypothetical protein